MRDIAARYASAGATSHLATTSEQLLAEAQRMQAGLSLRALQANIVELESAMESGRRVTGGDKGMREDEHRYQYDKMHPGPLSDPKRPNDSAATGFFGGQYDEVVLSEDRLSYRVATAKEAGGGTKFLGRWYTEQPLRSGMQLQIDTAVKPVWQNPEGRITGTSPPEMSLVVRVPKGTKIYKGPVASQGLGHLGGPAMIQVFIPDIRTTPGVELVSSEPFKPHGKDIHE